MNIVLLGPPGCGKGTQSDILSHKFQLCKISTGEILRENITRGTEIGLMAKSLVDLGEFVKDEIIISMVEKRILENDCNNGFILDGFPRNLNQVDGLEIMLKKIKKKIDFVFEFIIKKSLLLERILKRSNEEEIVRADDNENVLNKRIQIYEQHTKPIIPLYEQKGLLHKIDAVLAIKEVTKEIDLIVDNKKNI